MRVEVLGDSLSSLGVDGQVGDNSSDVYTSFEAERISNIVEQKANR